MDYDYIKEMSEKELWNKLSAIYNAELDEAWNKDGCIPFGCVPYIVKEAQIIEQELGIVGTDHAYRNNWEQIISDYEKAIANGRSPGF